MLIKKLIKMFLVIKLIRVPLEVIDNSLIIPFELHLVESGHDQDDLFDRSVTKQFISNRFINRKHPRVHLVPVITTQNSQGYPHEYESYH